jgi:hypothetical protein
MLGYFENIWRKLNLLIKISKIVLSPLSGSLFQVDAEVFQNRKFIDY